MNELAAATAAYQPLFDFIKKLNNATQYSHHGFLQATFGMKMESKRGGGYGHEAKHKVDLSTWPSAESITSAGTRLADAYNAAHRVYESLPSEDREYVKPPPWQPDLKEAK